MTLGTVVIIGVGLIGGSLGEALRERGQASKVIGVSRKQSTLDIAKQRRLIDEGTTDVAEAVKAADIVVLCTPLSSYASLTEQIAPNLKEGAILTDVGSVKGAPSDAILSALSDEQQTMFVPGHPIAGTENSGPEAAFAMLFDKKKVILTPHTSTSERALHVVESMWQSVGAELETLDMKRHDEIYATVSHLVQLLSSAYMVAISSDDSRKRATDSWFKQFIRLAGSDAHMWRDIFEVNHNAIAKVLAGFNESVLSLKSQLQSGDKDALKARLSEAHDKREHFHELLKKRMPNIQGIRGAEVDYVELNGPMLYVPRLLACALIEQIETETYDYATGSGLHGFTQPLLYADALEVEPLVAEADMLCGAMDEMLETTKSLFEAQGDDQLHQLEQAKSRYQDWIWSLGYLA